jgi:sentrin-specific protease 1
VWCKNDSWIGGYCVEKKVHVCSYCKKLETCLVRPESVKNFIWYSSSEEEDAEESLVPNEIEESLRIIWKNIHWPQMRLPMQHHLASDGAVPGCRVRAIPAANISSALTTLINVIERDCGMGGREGVSFHVREYWRPNRLVSFKTFATPVLFMGRRERKKAPNKTQTNIAKELWQCIHSREETIKLMRPLMAEERSVVVGATTKGIGSPSEILASQGGDFVQRGSMQTLRPDIWLSDEVINYFPKNCLKSRDIKICAKEPGRRRPHFFNSFFVQTMFNEKNINRKLRGRYNYENVKGWSKKVPGKDIFNLKHIFFPINLNNKHWTVSVIFMEAKRIQYYDSMGGKSGRAKLEGLLQYVKDEYRAKNGKEMDDMEWELVSCNMDTPRQGNGELYLSVLG